MAIQFEESNVAHSWAATDKKGVAKNPKEHNIITGQIESGWHLVENGIAEKDLQISSGGDYREHSNSATEQIAAVMNGRPLHLINAIIIEILMEYTWC